MRSAGSANGLATILALPVALDGIASGGSLDVPFQATNFVDGKAVRLFTYIAAARDNEIENCIAGNDSTVDVPVDAGFPRQER